ncbi:MAG: thiamine pyrophosphate-dependent enzyme, partial [Gaiellaceae bacterium]
QARGGGGPFLLECLIHRLRGHYEGDPQRYREAVAAEERRRLDPIARLGVEDGSIEQEARAEVEEAERFARASPFPPPELTTQLVYA